MRRYWLPVVVAVLAAGGALAAGATQGLQDQVLSDPQSAELGERLFTQNCVYCHGHQGSGGKAKPLQGREFRPAYLFKTISNGRRRGALVMPPWKRSLDERQRWQLVAYILSLSAVVAEEN